MALHLGHSARRSSRRREIRQVYERFVFSPGSGAVHATDAYPLLWRFGAAWYGLGERRVGEAIPWLLARRRLRQVERYRHIALFFPG
jgi:hypothetical protein